MAVGYEKLNSSAARSRRVQKREIPADQIVVTHTGTLFVDPIYGEGKTLECFVSDCDKVRCEFESGYIVTMRGGAIRGGIIDREKKNKP